MNKKKMMIGSALLIAVLAIWFFAVVPEFEKLPGDYSFAGVLDGTERPNYEVGGNSTEFIAYNGIKNIEVTKDEGDILKINAFFKAEELNGEPLYEISQTYGVNKKSREIIPGYEKNGFFLPPIGLEKKSYTIQNPTLLEDMEYTFEKINIVKGLSVYLFKGELNNLDTTEGYEFLDLVPERYTAVDDITEQIWIEPKTGIIVNFKQEGRSHYIEDGKKIHQFTQYTNSFSDDTITSQALKAQNEKFKLLLIRVILPVLFAIFIMAVTLFLSLREDTTTT